MQPDAWHTPHPSQYLDTVMGKQSEGGDLLRSSVAWKSSYLESYLHLSNVPRPPGWAQGSDFFLLSLSFFFFFFCHTRHLVGS